MTELPPEPSPLVAYSTSLPSPNKRTQAEPETFLNNFLVLARCQAHKGYSVKHWLNIEGINNRMTVRRLPVSPLFCTFPKIPTILVAERLVRVSGLVDSQHSLRDAGNVVPFSGHGQTSN